LRRQENHVDLVHRHRSCPVHGAADLRVGPRRPHPDGADVLGEVERVLRAGEGGRRAAPPQAADLSQGVEPGERVVQEKRLELGLGEAGNGRRGLLLLLLQRGERRVPGDKDGSSGRSGMGRLRRGDQRGRHGAPGVADRLGMMEQQDSWSREQLPVRRARRLARPWQK